MTIKKPDKWQTWEYANSRLRKSLPTDLVSKTPTSSEKEKYQGFLLTLALVFNDLKGILIINDSMVEVYGSPSIPMKVSGHSGEQQGIILQLFKLLLATLHEALVFIYESADVYKSEDMQRLLRSTSRKTQLVWEILNKIAHKEPVEDKRFTELGELTIILREARNNVGFHYQTRRRLIDGYRKFFFEGIPDIPAGAKEWAYRSTEKSRFDTSRYYYADAALQGYNFNLFKDAEPTKKYVDNAFRLTSLVINGINDLLIKYHEILPPR